MSDPTNAPDSPRLSDAGYDNLFWYGDDIPEPEPGDDPTRKIYMFPNGRIEEVPEEWEDVELFSLGKLEQQGFDPLRQVAVCLDSTSQCVDGVFVKPKGWTDADGREHGYPETDDYRRGMCKTRVVDGRRELVNPFLITVEQLAEALTPPHCWSLEQSLFGPGRTTRRDGTPGKWWPMARKDERWLGAQIVGADVDASIGWIEGSKRLRDHGIMTALEYETASCPCRDGDHQKYRVLIVLDRVITDLEQHRRLLVGLNRLLGADKNAKDASRMFYGGRSILRCEDVRMSPDELEEILVATGTIGPKLSLVDDEWDDTAASRPGRNVTPRVRWPNSGWLNGHGGDPLDRYARDDASLIEVAHLVPKLQQSCQLWRDLENGSAAEVGDGDSRWLWHHNLLHLFSNLSAIRGGIEVMQSTLHGVHAVHPTWSQYASGTWTAERAHSLDYPPTRCNADRCPYADACGNRGETIVHLFTRLWRGDTESVQIAGIEPSTEPTPASSQPKPRRWKPLRGLGEATDWMGDQKWVWDGWIPRGAISCMFGMPGIGKNWIAQHVAQVVTGQEDTFLDGSRLQCDAGEVLWIDYENEAGTTARRMRKGGFDPNRGILSADLEDGEQSVPMLTAKAKDGSREICNFIEEAIADHPNIRLVVIDSLFGGTHGVREKDSEFAAPLTDLTTTASRNDIAILILHHPRKPNGTDSQDDTEVMVHTLTENDLRGTIAILGVIRSLIAIDRPADSPARRIYLRKTSHAEGGSRRAGFSLEDSRVVPCDPPERARPERGRGAGKTDEVADWLRQFLSSGPKLKTTVDDAAEAEQFSVSTVGTASRRIGVVKERQVPSDKSSPYVWRLPGTDPVMVPDPIYEQELFGEK